MLFLQTIKEHHRSLVFSRLKDKCYVALDILWHAVRQTMQNFQISNIAEMHASKAYLRMKMQKPATRGKGNDGLSNEKQRFRNGPTSVVAMKHQTTWKHEVGNAYENRRLPCQSGSSSMGTALLINQSRPIKVVSKVLIIGLDMIVSIFSARGRFWRRFFSRAAHCCLPNFESSGSGIS